MAEKPSAGGSASDGKPVQVTCSPSSHEPSPSGASELQPYPPSRLVCPSNQSSILVPVRLDVLLFLLNSTARGAQYVLPPVSIYGAQGSPPPCHHGPPAQHVPSDCSFSPVGRGVYPTRGAHQYGGSFGSPAGIAESQRNRHSRDGGGHRGDGKSWPGGSSAGGWKTHQPTTGWQERPRGEQRGHDNRESWQGRRQGFERSWGNRRRGVAGLTSGMSSSRDRRTEGPAFGSSYASSKRSHGGCLRPPWHAPDAKQPLDNVRGGWQKSQGMEEPANSLGKTADNELGNAAAQEDGEDWETDYGKCPTSPVVPETTPCSSHSDVPAEPSKGDSCSFATGSPKSRPLASPSPEPASESEGVAAAAKPPSVTSDLDLSKNGGFVSYLKNLYSEPPRKSSSEDSSDLVIDTDVESANPEEEEKSTQVGADGELKPGE